MLKPAAILLIIAFVPGCSTQSSLERYVKDYGYTPFSPPRSADGAGTVIDFRNKQEAVVARASNCLLKNGAVIVSRRNVATADLNHTVTSNYGGSAFVPASMLKYGDVNALLKVGGVKSIKISLKEPFEETITRLDVTQYLNSLSADDPCRAIFENEINLLVSQTIGAKSIAYELLDNNEKTINLTVNILEEAKFSPELTRKFAGGTSISTTTEFLIGYRAWIVTKSAGLIGDKLGLADIKKSDLEEKREKSN